MTTPAPTIDKTVLITGATGDTGRAAVRESIALGLKVRAMVHRLDARSQALEDLGAQVVVGDLLEINTVRAAMDGIDAAYLVWPVQSGLIQATVNFAQAAKETGVKTVINLSQRSANRESTSDSCRDTFIAEEVLNWSGLPVIHLRPTYFLEWLLYPWQLPYLQQGVLRMPVGKGTHSPIAADDQGRAIAVLLKDPGDHIGTTIPLSGPVEMNHEQMAAELSETLGRKIVFQDLPVAEYVDSLKEMGVPPYIIQHLAGAMVDYQNGHMSGADNNVEKLTGRRSMTVGEFARAHADLLNGVSN
ncbi:NmrA family NAD(P)-binding protein [Streptomyces mirabilis]|uniref:NmrA family NAD(P)-binding protein n=1 Tax=Streptomyces mirabilis TaxID=68239 RepID=UPI0021BF88B3|nr:NmrA family NAD(P)-binding protein [Streptomyces mirabilis]MCT9114099.1 NmrA family NAD(P)-binding protein [Streptomyces mirabilis]